MVFIVGRVKTDRLDFLLSPLFTVKKDSFSMPRKKMELLTGLVLYRSTPTGLLREAIVKKICNKKPSQGTDGFGSPECPLY